MIFSYAYQMLADRVLAYAYEHGKAKDVDLQLVKRLEYAESDRARQWLAIKRLEAALKRRDRKRATPEKPQQAKAVASPSPTRNPIEILRDRDREAWLQRIAARNDVIMRSTM